MLSFLLSDWFFHHWPQPIILFQLKGGGRRACVPLCACFMHRWGVEFMPCLLRYTPAADASQMKAWFLCRWGPKPREGVSSLILRCPEISYFCSVHHAVLCVCEAIRGDTESKRYVWVLPRCSCNAALCVTMAAQ